MATDLPTNILGGRRISSTMAGAVQNAQHEFWRAPVAQANEGQPVAGPTMVEACDRCSTEFIVGAAFCHVCGTARQAQPISVSRGWTHYLEFHTIKEGLGLPLPSLIAFLIGVISVIAAVGVGFVFSAATVLDWQAVQVWRIEWLLAAVAAFVAGVLLKRTTPNKE
jgi:hypothetical protein